MDTSQAKVYDSAMPRPPSRRLNQKQFTLFLDNKTLEKLQRIMKRDGLSRPDVIDRLINAEYERLYGDDAET